MKVLLLHASAGSGHKRAAEAISRAFREISPSAEVAVRDILDFTPPLYRKTYAEGYLNVIRTVPELWGYMYDRSDRKSQQPWKRRIRHIFNKLNTLSFSRFFERLQPDAAICTHFMPLELLANRLGAPGGIPLYCVLTDFAIHSLWLSRGVAGYFVPTEEARRHLIRTGQPEERVSVTGIPVDPVFGRSEPAPVVRARLGMDLRLPLVLIMGGGCGLGPVEQLLEAFARRPPFCQIVVVAGKNEEMRQNAESAARRLASPVRVFGFVDNVHELMDAADIVVTKPGGLTSSEVLSKGKPMMIVEPIPGQEQRNCEYLLESGAAVRLVEVEDGPDKIRWLLGDRALLHRMTRNARRIGRPQAAQDIVRHVLDGAGARSGAQRTNEWMVAS